MQNPLEQVYMCQLFMSLQRFLEDLRDLQLPVLHSVAACCLARSTKPQDGHGALRFVQRLAASS